MAGWPTITPFGRPVEPEVKMMYAPSCGVGRAGRRRCMFGIVQGVKVQLTDRRDGAEAGTERGSGNQRFGRGVFQHHPQPLVRVAGVQRQPGGARLHNRRAAPATGTPSAAAPPPRCRPAARRAALPDRPPARRPARASGDSSAEAAHPPAPGRPACCCACCATS